MIDQSKRATDQTASRAHETAETLSLTRVVASLQVVLATRRAARAADAARLARARTQ